MTIAKGALGLAGPTRLSAASAGNSETTVMDAELYPIGGVRRDHLEVGGAAFYFSETACKHALGDELSQPAFPLPAN